MIFKVLKLKHWKLKYIAVIIFMFSPTPYPLNMGRTLWKIHMLDKGFIIIS